jgi:hypothetical protein
MTLPRPDLPVIALIAANLIPLFGVLYLGWDVGSIVVLYWSENLIVGGYTILKMLTTGGIKALFLILFFCVHYGGFCAIHGMFVLELTQFTGSREIDLPEETWPPPLLFIQMFINLGVRVLLAAPAEFLWACLALVLSHGVSFALIFIGRKEYTRVTIRQLMNAPYKRIVVMHIAIIAGGFLVVSLGSPLGLLLALVALKTAMDIMLHNRSHRETGKPATAAAPIDEPRGE